jgi:hypothetical protein
MTPYHAVRQTEQEAGRLLGFRPQGLKERVDALRRQAEELRASNKMNVPHG